MKEKIKPNFADILREATDRPGKLSEAYHAFHSYSFQNTLLAWSQLAARDIPIGPIATFKQWESKGRRILKGSKAICLCVPVPFSKDVEKEDGEIETRKGMFFTFKNNWFALSQTEGPEFNGSLEIPEFDEALCLKNLGIKKVKFEHTDGNIQGYAKHGVKEIAINPLAQLQFKTLIHEIAHIELGHTDQTLHDSHTLPKDIKEIEAESVALLVLESLGQPGAEYCRGYIQNWNRTGQPIDEKTAKRIIQAVDRILKAGSKENDSN